MVGQTETGDSRFDLVRVDAATYAVQSMRLGATVDGLAVGFGALWVREPDALLRFTPAAKSP